MSEKMCAFQQKYFYNGFLRRKTCKNSEISTGAGIPADRQLLTGDWDRLFTVTDFHLCYTPSSSS